MRDVSFDYGAQPVLRRAGLTVEDGSLTAVIGASGCGKTTLLRLLAGLERPASGSITIGGVDVAGEAWVPPHRRLVGMVPQEGALFPHLTLARNIALGLPRRAASTRSRVDELLGVAGLDGLGHRLPRELSGGQQQRAALLRALAPRPRLVLLDEPFGSLDADTRVRLRRSVRELLVAERATALLVTHDRDEALSMADAVAVLLDGAVAQTGPPDEVYRRPVSRDVARLLGEATFVPVLDFRHGRVATVLGSLPVLAAPDPSVGSEVLLRPEQVVLSASDGAPARVVSAEFSGAVTRVVLDLGPGSPRLVAAVPGVGVRVGEAVHVQVQGLVHLVPAVS